MGKKKKSYTDKKTAKETTIPPQESTTSGADSTDAPTDAAVDTNDAKIADNGDANANDPLAGYDIQALRDLYMRAEADKANILKRSEIQIQKTKKFVLDRFSRGICEVHDCLQAAISDGQDSEGVSLTLRKLSAVMEENGIRLLHPDLGASFDPNLHQAVGINANSEYPANTIAIVVLCGYTLNGRVIRPASVMVSKPEDKPK